MSTEQSLDPQVIEQTRQQIRSIVSEIAQLSKQGLSPQEFYGGFLTRIVTALAAVGGAVWTVTEEGALSLEYQIRFEETKLQGEDREEDRVRHARLLHRVLQSGEGGLMAPHSGPGDEESGVNPTEFLLVLGPLKTEVKVAGVVEVFQRADTGAATQKGYLRFLLQMCELAGEFIKSNQLRHFVGPAGALEPVGGFHPLDPRQPRSARNGVHHRQRGAAVDRLRPGYGGAAPGRKCRVEAISGQDLFDKRSNTVRLLGRLASEVAAAAEPIWYTGDTRDMAPQIEERSRSTSTKRTRRWWPCCRCRVPVPMS